MKKTGLINMARSPAELKADNKPSTLSGDSKYPYGTRISLNTDQLKKLGITELPEMGDEYSIVGVAKVTRASSSASESGSETSMELILTHLSMTHENDVEEKAETPEQEQVEQIAPTVKVGIGLPLTKPGAMTMR
jgi:hypothetical protein